MARASGSSFVEAVRSANVRGYLATDTDVGFAHCPAGHEVVVFDVSTAAMSATADYAAAKASSAREAAAIADAVLISVPGPQEDDEALLGADAHGHALRRYSRVMAAPTGPSVPPAVLAIFGPTAVGKTALAVALALRLLDGR